MPSLASNIFDLSPDPWGLDDLAAYLSRHHCLENLQFVQDVSRYRVYYSKIVGGNQIPRASLRCHYDYVQALWEDLLGTYILPNGHREVNLPSEVRDRLLEFRSSDCFPHPSELDGAVEVVHQLMEDSVLPGFSNSHMSEQPGDRGHGKRRGIASRDRRKISTSSPELDRQRKLQVSRASRLRASCLRGDRGDGEDRGNACYACCHSIGGAETLPCSHLLQRMTEVFNHAVRGVRSIRWLKPLIEKDGEAEVEIST
ncbi:RGS domain-containing protein [Stachybotrys elegans]|uniref:RGS domain-containing protein n=1 Tax=Stachybotrys elegans TaxID=80388 RepID=A0A8K0SCI9_9HYPO|nr:RGS domain-containing protein [Stachybotrys elegans]